MTSAEFLFQQFAEAGDIGPASDYVLEKLPDGEYESAELSSLTLDNPKGKNVSGSIVWFPKGKRKALDAIKFTVMAHSQDCTFYFLRIPRGTAFRLNGPGHSVLNLNVTGFKMMIRTGSGDNVQTPGCRAIIGEGSFCGGASAVLIDTTLAIKKGSLWSDGILVQGTNQHGIVDLETMETVEYPRNRITLEPHAWIARRAILCAGAHIGAGSIVGTGALVANRVPAACIVGGNPARIIKRNRTWSNNLYGLDDIERAMITEYVVPPPAPAESRFKALARSAWARATAAGAAGAGIFEAIATATEAFG